jgi:cytochrome c556
MNRVQRLLGGLAASVLVGTGCGKARPTSGGGDSDQRQPIPVPVAASETIRAEMRTMLGSVHRIVKASPAGDTAAMRRAAAQSGMAMAADPALEKLLPEGFLRLGMDTHRQFDELAAAIGTGMPRDSVTARLARVTGNCVSCHETYRLVVR